MAATAAITIAATAATAATAFEGSGTLTYYGGNVTADGGSSGWQEDSEDGEDGNAFASTYNVVFENEPTEILDMYDDDITADDIKSQEEVYIVGETADPIPTYNLTAKEGATGVFWATFYSNASNYLASSGTQVFKVNLSGNAITMIEITDGIVKSGQGVVLKNTTGSSITMTPTASAGTDNYSGNSLAGTMTEINTTSANNYYVLNYKAATGAGFYKLSNTSEKIGANKAYLTYSGAGAPEFFSFDESTGIDATLVNSEKVNGVVYDLQGRRVSLHRERKEGIHQ